ncbi:lysine-specific demethylase JMJ705 [Iris pallida]|uniref:Lysine-specific demethylase JMJ705 n=1 Tax=Iris pallida TaxID=29817 RepID=A0AAX6E6S1_IRIPA|nr:lysine-specific demethylase JMJ705 [Iris pallida]
MSPEVLVSAGIPCCRLVQNAGEFVVTFPGAYHSGFSHGFNCGEAANIATPEWLKVAKEAAVRRASTNYPPMVSHFQLLYTLALSLCSRMSMTVGSEPRSSRLKDKMRGEGEAMIKDIFVQNVIETNALLSILHDKGSSCIVLPRNAPDSPLCSNSFGRSHLKIKPRLSLGLCSREEALEASKIFPSNDVMLGRNPGVSHLSAFSSLKGSSLFARQGTKSTSESCNKSGTAAWNFLNSDSQNLENEKEAKVHGDGLLDQGLLSCVTCGILSFTCVAVVHPREAAARYLMSVDYGFLNDQNVCSGEISDVDNETNWKRSTDNLVSGSGQMENHQQDVEVGINDTAPKGISALALLVSAYGDSSDSEAERLPERSITDKNNSNHEGRFSPKHFIGADGLSDENSHHIDELNELKSIAAKDRCNVDMEFSDDNKPENVKCDVLHKVEDNKEMTSSCSIKSTGEPMVIGCREVESCHTTGNVSIHQSEASLGSIAFGSTGHFAQPVVFCSSAAASGNAAKTTQSINVDAFRKISTILVDSPDKDSSRMHVFCLEHAVEVEKLLHPIGGVNIILLCHPDYPKIEAEAKSLAEELGNEYIWKNVDFKEATQEEQETIHVTLKDEESIPTNSDWAVKMGINLYYSANLSKSPLYSKQMPYNAVIYKAFGCSTPNNSPVKPKPNRRKLGRQKKIIVAGKWCGKVWMSNQVHPYLAHRKVAQERELSEKLRYATPEKVETESDNRLVQSKNSQKGVSDARKSGKKRKQNPSVTPFTKKPRCTPQELDDSSINSEVPEITHACGMVLRSCRKLTIKDEDEGPKTAVRRRSPKAEVTKMKSTTKKKEIVKKKAKKEKASPDPVIKSGEAEEYACDIEGCSMNFRTKQDLVLHKKDICPEKGCGKKFFSHKYLVQHRKVHMDDRPLECPWKGCDMRFKWAWARTEHIRVHTGDRPYVCIECGQTFRFVSDFSRHKRKTGHVVKKGRR